MIGAVPGSVIVAGVAFAIAIGAFMLIPLLVVIASSLSGSEFLVFPPRNLSLKWYAEVLRSDAYLAAGWTSLKLAFITVLASLSLGTAAAIALARFAIPGRALLSSLFLSPLILPSLIFAIGLLMVFSSYANHVGRMEQLVVEGVTKRFGTQTVLRRFDLRVKAGEFVALLGPSGCGKSTLLRIIAGLDRFDEGRVFVAGREVTGLPPEKRSVALMFQSYALLPHVTVFENVRFPLRMQNRHARAEQTERARAALRLVQLEALGDRYPRQLSGGQQQRVALARSIVAEPEVLLLDEPLSNLDARLREGMQVELKRLHDQLGLTTVFVTHDQTEALALAGNVVLMNAGVNEQQGTPEEIYQRPRTAFAADFIGGANVLALDVLPDRAGWRGRLPDGTTVPLDDTDGLAAGRRRFMLRKEAISLTPDEAMVTVPGKVEIQNFLGGQTRSVIAVGGLRLVAVNDSKKVRASVGELRIGWSPSDLMLLDD